MANSVKNKTEIFGDLKKLKAERKIHGSQATGLGGEGGERVFNDNNEIQQVLVGTFSKATPFFYLSY